jgi:hypothetical protein
MAHIAHQPGPVCLESGVSRWVVVGVVGLGVELHQRPQAARGVLLQFEWLGITRGTQAFRAWRLARKAMRGMAELRPLFPGGPGGTKPLLFTTRKPSQNVQEENHS